ncbi:MAG TPA: S8 family peptidase [bacterium]|nr:S8 family peptidase [bacterium]
MRRLASLLTLSAVPLLLLSSSACSPDLPSNPRALRWVDRRVIAKFRDSADPHRIEEAKVRIGARTWERLPLAEADLLALDGAVDVPRALADLADYPDVVEYAEPDFLYDTETASSSSTPSDYDPSLLWGLEKIDAPDAWRVTEGDPGIVVAVIDTGIDAQHPDLAANVWSNPAEHLDGTDEDGDGLIDDVHGWNFVDGTPDPIDDVSHGTHVSGTIAAEAGNGGIVGVAPHVTIMPLKFLGQDGGTSSAAVKAIAYARTHGARIISASWGGRGYSSALYGAVKKAGEAGILFVAAAGNGDAAGVGQDADASPEYPAAFQLPNVISVAATDRHDRLAPFSNFGATSVDLAAPGVGIVSTVPHGGYASYDGTSMATPHVSGAAALILSRYPELGVAQVKEALLSSAHPVPALAGRVVSGGRLDAAAALARAETLVHGGTHAH